MDRVSARTIDRILRSAGHPRHDGRTRTTRYSVGYMVDEPVRDWPVVITWDGGHDASPECARDSLGPLAATLAAAGYRAETGEQVVPLGDGEFRWPCLIVTKSSTEEK